MDYLLLYSLLPVLVIFSAFFSSSEIALAKANKVRIHLEATQGKRSSRLLEYINCHYVESIATILMGNNLVNIAAASVSTVLMADCFGSKYGPAIASVGITIVLLIFGETIPKILAAVAPDQTARLFCWPLRFFMVTFYPVVWLVTNLIDRLSPLWTPKCSAPQITTEELCELVEDIEDAGIFTDEESDLIRSAIEFTETSVNEILTPRVDVLALNMDEFDPSQPPDSRTFRYSLIPVYQDTIDNIIGILSTRQLLREWTKHTSLPPLSKLMQSPLYIHMTCPLSTALDTLRREHQQMAIVLDEFGGVLGVVTMEDILEELVGDIYDERDIKENVHISPLNNFSFLVDGSINIYDLFDFIHFRPALDFNSEYTTVGGWLTELMNKFPEEGDRLTYENLELVVLKTEDRRVRKLKVSLLPQENQTSMIK